MCATGTLFSLWAYPIAIGRITLQSSETFAVQRLEVIRPMSPSPEVQRRISALDNELRSTAASEGRRATRAYLVSQTFVFLALGCSIAAAICGVFFKVSPRIVGGLAALPPLVAYLAANFRFDVRENWYYRKSVALEGLRSRLQYQLPEEPTVENVAAIAAARDKLVASMQAEWYETITKGLFENLGRSRITPRSSESSSAPSPD